jgi:phosphoribosylanthranilate isomerase
MTNPVIKICGLTSFEDAKAAVDAGADWLGFIFVPESPRALSMETAKSILSDIKVMYPKIRLVGVFQDVSAVEIQSCLSALPLDAVQLHGNEMAEEFSVLGVPIIKVLLLHPETSVEALKREAQAWIEKSRVEFFLLDLPKGSGLKCITEWQEFSELKKLIHQLPCLVAGGLNPDNVEQVIGALCPLGVDVASGVEQHPGKKDITRMQNFCRTVKTFKPQTDSGESIPCNR